MSKTDSDRKRRAIRDAGTRDHYLDAALYDHEYRRRRADVRFYRALALSIGGGPTLELGCGSGRVALALARAGVTVFGIDLSLPMLQRAAQRRGRLPRQARPRLHLVAGDLRSLPFEHRFPLVIAAFNTLQHIYDADELVRVLHQVRRVLAPGGCFAFDVLKPDLAWLVRDPRRRWARTRFKHPTTGEPLIYTTNHAYDAVAQVADIRIYYDPPPGARGRRRVVRLAHRQYFPQELRSLVQTSGLTVARSYGGFAGEPLDDDSDSQLLLTCCPADAASVAGRAEHCLTRIRSRA